MADIWEGLWKDPLIRPLKVYPPGGDIVADKTWFRKMQETGDSLHDKLEAINLSILTARQKLYDNLPVGDIDAFELLKIIQGHIKELDDILEGEA